MRKNNSMGSTRPPDGEPPNKVTFVSSAEMAEIKRRLEAHETTEKDIDNYFIEVASMWPDFSFTTPDGRQFSYLWDFGDSIIHRLLAMGFMLSKKDKQWLYTIRGGVIIEVSPATWGCGDPPIKFADSNDGEEAWIELHRSFGVPFSELE